MTGSSQPPPPDGADPSMEEILASIRKILNEDDNGSAPPASSPVPDDVLVLDESMMVAAPAETAPLRAPGDTGGRSSRTAPESEDVTSDHAGTARGEAPQADLIAPEAAAAAASSLGSLVRTLSSGRAAPPVYSGGPTLEDMVRAELRPALQSWLDANLTQTVDAIVRAELRVSLKAWLDANLPATVERLVRAEIERVVRRAVP